MIRLNQQQLNFFDTFGYLALPELMADCIDEIIDAFEQVWVERGGGHDGQPHDGERRSCIVPFHRSTRAPVRPARRPAHRGLARQPARATTSTTAVPTATTTPATPSGTPTATKRKCAMSKSPSTWTI